MPDTQVDAATPGLNALQDILPYFFVPRLEDKPQNPILDAPVPISKKSNVEEHPHTHPPTIPAYPPSNKPGTCDVPWSGAIITRNYEDKSQVISWDALSHGRCPEESTPFLSERHSTTFAAARYHVMPRLDPPQGDIIYVSIQELFNSLKLTVLGTSSGLHSWDPVSETFTPTGRSNQRTRIILIGGQDEVASQSLLRRFLVIGTLFHRLETLITSLRARPARDGPTIHAFTHTLSTVLTFLQEELAQWPPTSTPDCVDLPTLTTIWMHFGKYEDILTALSVLCGREEGRAPSSYILLDSSPSPLLSRIYDHLNSHIERHSSRTVISAFAYILSLTSCDYFRSVCRSVGVGEGAWHHKWQDVQLFRSRDEINTENYELDLIGDCEDTEEFPTFFSPGLVNSLLAARKSLAILRTAQPEHPYLKSCAVGANIVWVWTDTEIQTIWSNAKKGAPHMIKTNASSTLSKDVLNPHKRVNESDMSYFRMFDLDPGSHSPSNFPTSQTGALRSFMSTFPESLPSITPTLTNLTYLVFSPLLEHISRLSSHLLSIFLSPLSSLNFPAQLILLRSYLLLTSHSFRSRLTTALFSDSVDCEVGNHPGCVFPKQPFPEPPSSMIDRGQARPWAVGLASALTDRESWPPGGADLSFLLRTVIVDSLELGHSKWGEKRGSLQLARDLVFSEADSRLAFAIRDLPLDPSRSQWLNPLSIEALDFLYLDYKPPHPLGVLITPEILSRYQRIFAFMLRMLRVESVVGALYRMTCKGSRPLFPTLTSSNKLLLHFRFIVHSFVTSLTGYLFDTAIGGNFDSFVMRLSRDHIDFSDVFSLAQAHTAVLDTILSACLLRSIQKAAGDILRGALEIVLELGILAGELHRGQIEEYQAAPLLEGHFRNFCAKMRTLTSVLKAFLAEKGDVEASIPVRNREHSGLCEPSEETKTLYHLLIRLDLKDWWSKE